MQAGAVFNPYSLHLGIRRKEEYRWVNYEWNTRVSFERILQISRELSATRFFALLRSFMSMPYSLLFQKSVNLTPIEESLWPILLQALQFGIHCVRKGNSRQIHLRVEMKYVILTC